MALFKKKKKEQTYETTVPEIDINELFEEKEVKEEKSVLFGKVEQAQFVRQECEQIIESARFINDTKPEYQTVKSYINDYQLINQLPKETMTKIQKAAETIDKLTNRRKKIQDNNSRLTDDKYRLFDRKSDEFPEALIKLQNDEKYCLMIKHDMKMLEAEKVSVKEDIHNYGLRQSNIRNISILSVIGIAVIVALFLISGKATENSGTTVFMVVIFCAALYVLMVFLIMRNTTYNVKLSEKKLNKAITLLNKTKIKYVNVVNSIDYQLEKYHVGNSMELSTIYQDYLEDKREKDRYVKTSNELKNATDELAVLLDSLELYDYSVWMTQYGAFIDENIMQEVKYGLEQRYDKLKKQIDYNMKKIEEAKLSITSYVRMNPDKAKEVLAVVDSYDVDL